MYNGKWKTMIPEKWEISQMGPMIPKLIDVQELHAAVNGELRQSLEISWVKKPAESQGDQGS